MPLIRILKDSKKKIKKNCYSIKIIIKFTTNTITIFLLYKLLIINKLLY